MPACAIHIHSTVFLNTSVGHRGGASLSPRRSMSFAASFVSIISLSLSLASSSLYHRHAHAQKCAGKVRKGAERKNEASGRTTACRLSPLPLSPSRASTYRQRDLGNGNVRVLQLLRRADGIAA